MPDYKEMYFTMVRAVEDAIRILIEAQCKCEEIYLSTEETTDEMEEETRIGSQK